MSSYPQLYRNTTVGVTLQETLDEMIAQNALTERAAGKILSEFDRSINLALAKQGAKKVNFSGKLDTYRFCDSVWTFVVKDFSVKEATPNQHGNGNLGDKIQQVEKVKIVACDGKNEGKNATS